MENSKKRLIVSFFITIVALFIIGGCFYIYTLKTQTNQVQNTTDNIQTSITDKTTVSTTAPKSIIESNVKNQPKAPKGYLTPDSTSMPSGYTYSTDYGSNGSTLVYTYVNKQNPGEVSFTQSPDTVESYTKLVSDFTSREKTIITFNSGVILEGLNSNGTHNLYRLIYNNSGKVLEIYAKGDKSITPEVLKNLLQRMY